MKNSVQLLLIAAILPVSFFAKAEVTQQGGSEEDGPFYVMDWDEFKKITKEQKSYYLGQLIATVPKVTSLKTLSKDKILAAGKNSDLWNEMEDQISKACEEKAADGACKTLQQARVQTFKRGTNH
ncbi:hypothetical protein B9G69_002210 [Bdellovibrio sp. SKB1291214]|uniref:hypothetical protein n=1 Tax=Bdellovibrio sp. SKB1291214 TaxID=1732569 RepID=UPI000B51AFAD|nr:hypothetical protein [Bdellovibrio sp. SKB1291214]UYL09385.1 hypothetical protein B9G69_002210 [Bdellovibrio sp. SKB1291214]